MAEAEKGAGVNEKEAFERWMDTVNKNPRLHKMVALNDDLYIASSIGFDAGFRAALEEGDARRLMIPIESFPDAR